MTEQEELQYLLANSPKALPDDPSSSGWSTSQIKEKHYKGLVILYNWIKAIRTAYIQTENIVNALNDNSTDKPLSANMGKTLKELIDSNKDSLDADISRIDGLLASNDTSLDTIQKIVNFIKNNKSLIDGLSSGKINVNAIVDDLLSTDSTKVLSAKQGKTLKDLLDAEISNRQTAVANEILARQNADELLQNNINAEIGKLTNGTTIVDKAYKDHNGNNIDSTYVKISNIINALNDTSTNKPLSAAQGKALKDMIDAINTLLSSDTTTLDTLQEVVNYIKNNKSLIDGITISKMAFTDLVKNLTTNNDNLPLAASQGYALKAMIDAINDAENGIQAAEALRIIAEAARVEAEEARQTGYSGFDGRITANANAITGIKDGTNIDSFADVESALSDKADSSDVYNKTEVYTKAEAEALINAKCKETSDNLRWELGTYDLGVESDNTSALVKTMPSGTIKLNVNEFDGASEVSENIMVVSDIAQITDSDLTISRTNAILKINGTSNRAWSKDLGLGTYTLPAGTYTLACFNNVVVSGVHSMRIDVNGNAYTYLTFDSVNKVVTITLTETSTLTFGQLGWANGVVFNNFQCSFMLVKGSTAPTDFKVGYTGIHNLELSGLKVEGYNLFDKDTANINKALDTANGYLYDNSEYMTSDYIAVIPNTQYSDNVSSIQFNICYYDKNKTFISGQTKATPYTIPLGAYYIRIQAYKTRLDTFMIVRGSTTPTTYEAHKPTITLPIDLTTIEDSGGNKLFANGELMGNDNVKDVLSVYNQESAWDKVDLGSFDYSYNSTLAYFYTNFSGAKIPDYRDTFNGVCTILSIGSVYDVRDKPNPDDYSIALSSNGIVIRCSQYTDATTFKTAMSGVMLQYERNTYLTSNTDLSATLRNIQGYPNGSITLTNTYDMATTSEIDYLIEEVKA